MEDNLNIGFIQQKKRLEEEIMDDIERDYLITNFHSNFKEVFPEIKDQLTKKKIYFSFVLKYLDSKEFEVLLKRDYILKQNYVKKINYIYIYSLFYIYLRFQLFDKIKEDNKKNDKYKNKIISMTNYFRLIKNFYKSQMLNWKQIINILKYLIYQIKNSNNELSTSIKISILSAYIKFFAKILKEMKREEKEKVSINEEIKKDILEELFEILADNKNNGNYLYLMRNMIKEESIFCLIKIIVKSDFLSEDNIQYIETNIIKLFKNNFRKEHLNYFYKIFNKILIRFNKFIPNKKKEKEKNKKNEKKEEKEEQSSIKENEDYEKYFNLINNDFDFLVKINEILTKVIKEEKDQITKNNPYYCDKGFVFNNREKERIGFKVKDISYTKKNNSNFCILFSFQLKNSGDEKDDKIIFSIVDSNNNEKLTLLENGTHIILRYLAKNMIEKNLCKVEYNTIFNFLLFNDKNRIKVSINNNDVLTEKTPEFKLPEIFQFFVGCPDKEKKEYSFNGIIYPIILFEANELKKKEKDIYVEFKHLLSSVKNKYYLIAEEYFNYQYNIKNKKDKEKENVNIERIMHNYVLYYGLADDLTKQKKMEKFLSMGNNIILYINPYIILSSFNKKALIYKDYNTYEDENKKKSNYFYEFNVIPSLDQGKIYSFRDYSIVSFFKTSNGFNFIILQIEVLFNYILLLSRQEDYIKFLNSDKSNFFKKM